MLRHFGWFAVGGMLAAGLCTLPTSSALSAEAGTLAEGGGRIEIAGAAPDGTAVSVWTYRPRDMVPTAPIVIVMHGTKRNARDYRDDWIDAADRHGFLIAAPEMSKAQFRGGRGYSQGNMFAKGGGARKSPSGHGR